MSDACPPAFIDLAGRLADAAGVVARRYFRQPVDVEAKADQSPVTVADREAEAVMRELIEAEFPDHGIAGEEHGDVRTDAEYVWHLDPIDGTRSFISGKPVFGILVGLAHHGRPLLGVIDQPVNGERWLGAAGRPTTLNGQPVSVRACPGPALATMFTTGREWYQGDELDALERMLAAVKMTMWSSDCYGFALLSTGFADIAMEASMENYDFCALVPVVEGAGGIFSDWQGNPVTIGNGAQVLAAGDARVHVAALKLLAGEGQI
ncbi:MAG: inositol monophosphatase family protein [Alphaproteobacteria bacterium]|nr:inositol monophosphatase family protein [Alphaproteobacteria bacterium]HJP23607.1 inositol monophosphatase family protein [Alphaproteobacteria bacterium]